MRYSLMAAPAAHANPTKFRSCLPVQFRVTCKHRSINLPNSQLMTPFCLLRSDPLAVGG